MKLKNEKNTGWSQRPQGQNQTHEQSNYRGLRRRREEELYDNFFEEIIVEILP